MSISIEERSGTVVLRAEFRVPSRYTDEFPRALSRYASWWMATVESISCPLAEREAPSSLMPTPETTSSPAAIPSKPTPPPADEQD